MVADAGRAVFVTFFQASFDPDLAQIRESVPDREMSPTFLQG